MPICIVQDITNSFQPWGKTAVDNYHTIREAMKWDEFLEFISDYFATYQVLDVEINDVLRFETDFLIENGFLPNDETDESEA